MMAPTATLILSFLTTATHCAWFTATVPLNGAQEVPPNDAPTAGTARMQFNDITGQLVWSIEHNMEQRVTAAHIHGPASANETAGVQVNMGDFSDNYESPIVGATFLTPNQSFELMEGRWYINLHSAAYSNGEIRGQVGITMDVLRTWGEEFEYSKVLYPESTDGHFEVFWSVFVDGWIGLLLCALSFIYDQHTLTEIAAQTVGWVGFGVTKTPQCICIRLQYDVYVYMSVIYSHGRERHCNWMDY